MPDPTPLDCLVIGGGPAGLTAALYLARFQRRFLVVDAGAPRAAWIPVSHNIPFFADGIAGPAMLHLQRQHLERYAARVLSGTVTALSRTPDGFTAEVAPSVGLPMIVAARHVLLATGAEDIEPALPDLVDAVRGGQVRYCPICDGYEARDRRIAVLGHGTKGLGEALFIARTYGADVTLLTLGEPMELDRGQVEAAAQHGVRLVVQPVVSLDRSEHRIEAVHVGEETLRFDILYSALGLRCRSAIAVALGAAKDGQGALVVDEHNRTSVPRLYAAGGVVKGLDQVVVAMGHAAIAATAIHNRCALPTEEEHGS